MEIRIRQSKVLVRKKENHRRGMKVQERKLVASKEEEQDSRNDRDLPSSHCNPCGSSGVPYCPGSCFLIQEKFWLDFLAKERDIFTVQIQEGLLFKSTRLRFVC